MRSWVLSGLACLAPLYAQTPVISGGGIVNAASPAIGQAVSPGSLISIFGSDLAAGANQAMSLPLTTTLGDVSVMINDVAAPLLYVSSGQINAQFPFNAMADPNAIGTANVVVRRGSAQATSPVQVAPFSPGIFSAASAAGQIAIAINGDGSLAAPAGSIPGLATQPTRIGGVIIILCTGLGPVDPPVASGVAPGAVLRRTVNQPTVLIGGQEATIFFSGLSPEFPGVYQLNVQVAPGTPTGNAVPLQIRQGSVTTTNQVIIAVQ